MTNKAVGYIRISQKDENIDNQKMKINEFAKNKGFEIIGFFADIDISGTIPPRKRPQYNAMLQFCKNNNIQTIIFYDLSRLSRDVIEGLLELKRLTEEGYNIYFAAMDFLNYDLDPMMKKKIIMDFLWFAELYVSDIRNRTKVAMERLRKEGKIYHRPTLLHYIALYLSNKKEFRELTREDIENAKHYLRNFLKQYIELRVPIYQIRKILLEHFREMYRKYPHAPKSYQSVSRLIRQLFSK